MRINKIIAYSVIDDVGDVYIRLNPNKWLRDLWPGSSGLEELCFAEYQELEEQFKRQEQQDYFEDRHV